MKNTNITLSEHKYHALRTILKSNQKMVETDDWVIDCCLTPLSSFPAISWPEQVNFQWDDDEVRFVLDQRA